MINLPTAYQQLINISRLRILSYRRICVVWLYCIFYKKKRAGVRRAFLSDIAESRYRSMISVPLVLWIYSCRPV